MSVFVLNPERNAGVLELLSMSQLAGREMFDSVGNWKTAAGTLVV